MTTINEAAAIDDATDDGERFEFSIVDPFDSKCARADALTRDSLDLLTHDLKTSFEVR